MPCPASPRTSTSRPFAREPIPSCARRCAAPGMRACRRTCASFPPPSTTHGSPHVLSGLGNEGAMNDLSAGGRARPTLLKRIFTTDDRALGIRYLLLSLVAVFVGTLLSLAMRVQLASPGIRWPLHGPMLPEEYLSLVTMHGTLMV